MAVIDEVVVRHMRPVDYEDGPYYRKLREVGVDPSMELRKFIDLYGLDTGVTNKQFGEEYPG